MHRTSFALLAAALATFAGCRSPAGVPGLDAAQGIDGMILLGPMCPVQQADDSCPDQPYRAWIDVLGAGGTQLARLRSDATGYFRVGLAPGSYVVHPESGDPLPRTSDQQVDVAAGAYTDITVTYDTGIR